RARGCPDVATIRNPAPAVPGPRVGPNPSVIGRGEKIERREEALTIALTAARDIVAAARAHSAKNNFKPLTIVVLDAGGHVVAVEREDGSSNKRFEVAFGKAHGALALGMGSRSIMARAEQQP